MRSLQHNGFSSKESPYKKSEWIIVLERFNLLPYYHHITSFRTIERDHTIKM